MEEAYLGVDIGSISTKGVIIDKNYKILASEYIWTEAAPGTKRRSGICSTTKTDRASGEAV